MTSTSAQSPWQPSTLVELLLWRAEHQPEVGYTFLADGETEATHLAYAALDCQARAIAARLAEAGATGERILLLYPPGLAYIAAFFGCLYAGAVPVPGYPPRKNRALDRIAAIAIDAQATFALTTGVLLEDLEPRFALEIGLASLKLLTTDASDSAVSFASTWQAPQVSADTLAFIQYTSGSTGTPKGVMVSHGNLLHNSGLMQQGFKYTPDSQGVIWLPPYHDMGLIGGILQPLYGGFPMTLMSPLTVLQKPYRWLAAISRYQATTSGGPNFAYDLCVEKITPAQRASLDLRSWDVAFNGAEPVRAETLERFATTFADCGFRREAFYPCYGMAEATLFISGGKKTALPITLKVNSVALEQHRVLTASGCEEDTRTLVSCGEMWPEQTVVIVDTTSKTRCVAEQVGEIWVHSPSVAQGYWHQLERTAETFGASLADTGAGPFLRTGDLGFMKNGELFITGRIKDLIIIRGKNHYPQDIELTVQHSHLALSCGCGAAFTVEVAGEEKLVIAQEVQRHYLRHLDVGEIIGHIRQAVTAQHALACYDIVLLKPGSVLKTSSGKIQRYAIRQKFLQGTLETVESGGKPLQGNRRMSVAHLIHVS